MVVFPYAGAFVCFSGKEKYSLFSKDIHFENINYDVTLMDSGGGLHILLDTTSMYVDFVWNMNSHQSHVKYKK